MDSPSIGISDIITSSEDSYEDFSFSFEQLITLLNSMIERKKGLESICVTDRDGVVVLKASNSSSGSKSLLTNPSIPVIFASLISSCEKLEEFGKASFAIVSFQKHISMQSSTILYPSI
ncbi:Mitogen-activated protein kinase kinase 1 interacting family protein [Cryptosporidium hominis]|uniref:Ragulator complex protein LAMTOR3 n=1 Tax=Cryptosporidium hominis TaxID=237895 RepID=A0ABX5BGJ7_CRYHO|nr:hypothetical protein ChTU502y2012_407g0310 [Cryptosporidium hominis]PPA62824.1 Mitogen-activated protein kinase kinase 1 interacting family protein [Cryptosporidium hominis]PPS95954.1 Ragulator complex protein LAMTOR3 [Cryptosporidium hominis]|eukprot:PPS95954.1 Ragulator complex protein LAMTOR3 [Cryptosporidium hominis]